MAYRKKGFSGGLGGLLGNLARGGQTSAENPSMADYPEVFGGEEGYISKSGSITNQPFSDTRGFFAKLYGAPNTAEALNLGVAEQRALTPELVGRAGALGKQANALEIEKNRALNPIEIERQFGITAAQLGLTPEQLASMSPDKVQTLLAQNAAIRAKAAEEAAKSATGEQVANTTRGSNVAAAGSEAERQATVAAVLNQYSQDPTFQAAMRAGALGQSLQPMATLQKNLSTDVGPGQIVSTPSLSSLLGDSPVSSLFGGTEARGNTVEKRMIPGQPIGNTGLTTQPTESFKNIPGYIRKQTPIDPSILRSVLGEEENLPTNEAQGQPPGFGVRALSPQTVPTTQPQMGNPVFRGGQISADIKQVETPEAKKLRQAKEAEEAMENIRRLLSNPYTPNRRNF